MSSVQDTGGACGRLVVALWCSPKLSTVVIVGTHHLFLLRHPLPRGAYVALSSDLRRILGLRVARRSRQVRAQAKFRMAVFYEPATGAYGLTRLRFSEQCTE